MSRPITNFEREMDQPDNWVDREFIRNDKGEIVEVTKEKGDD